MQCCQLMSIIALPGLDISFQNRVADDSKCLEPIFTSGSTPCVGHIRGYYAPLFWASLASTRGLEKFEGLLPSLCYRWVSDFI
jgi:hypothetical protein